MVGLLLGEEALSGVGTCGVLTNLLVAFSVGFSSGAGIISARHYGAKNEEAVNKNALAAMISLFAMGLSIGGLGFLFAEPLLRYLVSVPESLLRHSVPYFRICAVGFLFQFAYNGVASLLRSIGDSRASLYFLLISTLLNILLDYAFISFWALGVEGASYATIIAQFICLVISLAYMYIKYPVLRFFKKGNKTSLKEIALIARFGFPIALQSMVGTVFNLMIQRLVNTFGESMVASYTVVSRVEGYMQLPTSTIYQAMSTYASQNLGAKKRERIIPGLRQGVIMAVISTLAISIAPFALAPIIAGSFGIAGDSLQYCVEHIRWLSFPILLFALYFPCTGLYQGVGKGMVSTLLSTSFLLICLAFAFFLQMIPEIGYRSLFVCKPISWVIVSLINYVYLWVSLKKGKLIGDGE